MENNSRKKIWFFIFSIKAFFPKIIQLFCDFAPNIDNQYKDKYTNVPFPYVQFLSSTFTQQSNTYMNHTLPLDTTTSQTFAYRFPFYLRTDYIAITIHYDDFVDVQKALVCAIYWVLCISIDWLKARYNIEVLTLAYLHHIHGCLHKCNSSKAAAVQRCQLVTTLDGRSGTGGVQKCMQTGN